MNISLEDILATVALIKHM